MQLEPARKAAQVEALEIPAHSLAPQEADAVLPVQAQKDSEMNYGRPLVVLQEGVSPMQAPPAPVKLEPAGKTAQGEAVLVTTTHSVAVPEADDVLSIQATKDFEIRKRAVLIARHFLVARFDQEQRQKKKVVKKTTVKPANYSPLERNPRVRLLLEKVAH
jgi:hypothetical protein